ncbi:hypothetical protein SNE40_001379 [Patella caerulea]
MSHLRSNHGIEFAEFLAAQKEVETSKRKAIEEDNISSTSNSKQAKKPHQIRISEMVDGKVTPWSKADARTQRANSKLLEMIAIDLQPLSVVEDVGFRRYSATLEPRYKIPSKQEISRQMIPALYDKLKSQIKDELVDVTFIGVTTDIWSTRAGPNSLMSITAHWVDKDFSRKHATLNATSVEGINTEEAISEHISRMLNIWSITMDQVVTIIRGNVGHTVTGHDLTGINHQDCFIHTLQSVINDGILFQRTILDTLAIFRNVAGHFKHSTLACYRLRELQVKHGLPDQIIIQDAQARWNSSFYMVKRMLEQKAAIVDYANIGGIPQVTENHWNIADTLITTLQKFEELTRHASEEGSSTSMVIPSVYMLQRSLAKHADDRYIHDLAGGLLKSLNNRYEDVEKNKLLVISTYLDPRYKALFFKAGDTEKTAVQWLMEEGDVEKTDLSRGLQESPITSTPTKSAIDDEFDQFVKEQGAPQISHTGININNELTLYSTEPILGRSEEPLAFWKINRHRYPILAKLAAKYLCVPPSSVPSERLFSEAGDLYDEKRNRLDPNMAEMLLTIRGNYERLNF